MSILHVSILHVSILHVSMKHVIVCIRQIWRAGPPGGVDSIPSPSGPIPAVNRGPKFACHELGGTAWRAQVVACNGDNAVVSFVHARTRAGRRYDDVRLQLGALRYFQSTATAAAQATD